MKISKPLCNSVAIISAGIIAAGSADAAFIIATDGTLGSGNYAFTGAGGTTASGPSITSAGNLPATTDAPPTFFTLAHVFGGNSPTGDEYTFTYSPSTDADNASFAAGTLYNSLTTSLTDNLTASGLLGGGAGIYNVYRLHPATTNVSGGLTRYDVNVNGGLQLTQTIDQNASNLATGENIGRWELIGSVPLTSATDTVTLTMTPTTNPTGFVSMRASGIMFEYTGPIPEPTSAVLLGLSALVLVGRRRR